jgi:hypothetical protein
MRCNEKRREYGGMHLTEYGKREREPHEDKWKVEVHVHIGI